MIVRLGQSSDLLGEGGELHVIVHCRSWRNAVDSGICALSAHRDVVESPPPHTFKKERCSELLLVSNFGGQLFEVVDLVSLESWVGGR